MRALPNCAMIGFTGTPIIVAGRTRRTHEIFGDYIDQYTIEQSQKDGSTVKILYEGRKAEARVEDGRTLDQFLMICSDRAPKKKERPYGASMEPWLIS